LKFRHTTARHVMALPVRIALIVSAVLATLVWTSAPAGAHAIVDETDPGDDEVVAEAPREVIMRFNEPVEISFGALRVFDSNRRRVDSGEAHHVDGDASAVGVPLDELDEGTYTVTWRVVSADGHPIEEAFVFHVGEPGPRPQGIASRLIRGQGGSGLLESVVYGVSRFANFVALLALGGTVVFYAFAWRRPRGGLAAWPQAIEERFARRCALLVTWSWTVVVVATVANLFLQAAEAGDLALADTFNADVVKEVLDTRFGAVTVLKLALLVAGGGLWAVTAKRGVRLIPSAGGAARGPSLGAAATQADLPAWPLAASSVLVVALLATPGLAGHAATTPPVTLNIVTDVLHMMGAAAWLGGLLVLLAVAFPASRSADDGTRSSVLAPVVARFSNLALIAVGVIVATGAFRSWVEVRALRGFVDAGYGQVLLAKISVVVPLLVLGAINNRWALPRIKRAAGDDHGALRVLKRVVTAEVALGMIVVGLTALLVNLAPARVSAGISGPFVTDVHLGHDHLEVLVDPNQVGRNFVHLTATTPEGSPAHIKDMDVLLTMPSENVGPLRADGRRLAPGHFVVQGNQLSIAGRWSLEVVARVDKFTEERATVRFRVNQ
jgi:copper transport protein